jgi:hypothetical protein
MKILVKVGKVEIEYSEPTEETIYPKIVSKDTMPNGGTKGDAFIAAIEKLVDKAADTYSKMEI